MSTKIKMNQPEHLRFLGFNLAPFSQYTQIGIVTCSFLASWMTYGVLQERLMNIDRFPYAWTITYIQVMIYSALGFLDYLREGAFSPGKLLWPSTRAGKIHLATLIFLSAAELVLHRGIGNVSFHYLDYSTKVLFQSAKILPVLVVGVLFFKKSYQLTHYVAALLISMGVGVFSAGKTDASAVADPDGFWTGVMLMSIVLAAEATKPNLWKAIFDSSVEYGMELSQARLLSILNGLGLLLMVPVIIWSGEMPESVYFLWENPRYWLRIAMLFFTGYVAQVSTMTHLKLTSALSNSILSTTRKILTIILSHLWFWHIPSTLHILGFILFSLGLVVSIQTEKHGKKSH